MSNIEVYVQGKNDTKIFSTLGPWLTSGQVRKELGAAITSENGDIWHIALVDGPIGFALTHPITGGFHIKNVYATTAPVRTREQLLKAALEGRTGRIYTRAPKTDNLWRSYDFKFTASERGEFGVWELTV